MTSLITRQLLLKQIVCRAAYQHELRSLPISTLQAALPQPIPKPSLTISRAFTTTPKLSKKGGKSAKAQKESSESTSAVTDDPYDFSTLQTAIEKVLETLKNDLSKLRTGGRFNPEVLENLRVELDKNTKLRAKLGELAQVVSKGRTVMVIVGEKDHIKPITSAILASPELNLQPQADPHNAQQLNIPIPPPTKESREQAIQAVSKAGETASMGVRNARGVEQKRFRGMELAKTVRPDDLKKAHKEMEKVVEKGVGDVKKMVDAAKKGME